MTLKIRIWSNDLQQGRTITLSHQFVSDRKLNRVIRKQYPEYCVASYQRVEAA